MYDHPEMFLAEEVNLYPTDFQGYPRFADHFGSEQLE